MKKLYTLILLYFPLLSIASTSINGLISSNTTWTLKGSPYVVTGTVAVGSGIVLTIEPGVTVEFKDTTQLKINGELVAIGKSDSMIVFTTSDYIPNPGSWIGIVFEPGSLPYSFSNKTGSIMQYCIVQYAGASNYSYIYPLLYPVTIYNSSPYLDHCTIQNNYGAVNYNSLSQTTYFTNNSVLNNLGYFGTGIHSSFSYYDTTATKDTLILHCNLFYGNGGGGNACSFNGNSLVENNMFINNTNSGDDVLGLLKKTNFIMNSVIDNIAACGDIILNYGVMKFNTITNNTNEGCNTTVSNYDSLSIFNFNNIYGDYNIGPPGIYYEYFNEVLRYEYNSPIMNAVDNWWGTTNTAHIDSTIYDYYDDTAECKVSYTPYLTIVDTNAPVTLVRNVIKTNLGGGMVQLNWTANPEPNIAGYKVYWGHPTGYSFTNNINVGNVTTYTLTGVSFNDTIGVTAYDREATDSSDQCLCHESWYSIADTVNPSGINEIKKSLASVVAYPNPSGGVFYFAISSIQGVDLMVYDVLGEKVYEQKNYHTQAPIDLSNNPSGIYLYRVLTETGELVASGKMVIEK